MNQYVTGAVIKQLREKANFTQAELAAKLNVSSKTISKWENDKCYPDVSLLPLVANIFGCSVDAILGIDNDTYGVGLQKILERYNNCKELFDQ